MAEAPELLVLAVHEDEAAVEVAEVDVGGHVVDQGPEPRLLGSLTLDDAPELRADAQQQLEELRVDGDGSSAKNSSTPTAVLPAMTGTARPARRPSSSHSADRLPRMPSSGIDARRRAPAGRIERDDRQRRRLGRIADQVVAGGEDRLSRLERDARKAAAGGIGSSSVAARNALYRSRR